MAEDFEKLHREVVEQRNALLSWCVILTAAVVVANFCHPFLSFAYFLFGAALNMVNVAIYSIVTQSALLEQRQGLAVVLFLLKFPLLGAVLYFLTGLPLFEIASFLGGALLFIPAAFVQGLTGSRGAGENGHKPLQ